MEGRKIDVENAYDLATTRLANVAADLRNTLPSSGEHRARKSKSSAPSSNISKDDFCNIVKTCIDYIHAGTRSKLYLLRGLVYLLTCRIFHSIAVTSLKPLSISIFHEF